MSEPKQINPVTIVDAIAEAIDRLDSNISMQRDRPYTGQSHTSEGIRGATEIKGVTIRDLRDAFIRAVINSHPCYEPNSLNHIEPNMTLYEESLKGPNAALCAGDIYTLKGDCSLMAVAQNLTCEIEKLMKIFPNVPGYVKGVGYNEEPVKIK